MKALITPGQGKIPQEILEHEFEERQHWRMVAESFLGKKITSENVTEHDVNSALIVANAFAVYCRYCSQGGEVDMVAGYSVGQYAALAMAGVLEPEVVLEIAVERARIMRRHTVPDMRMLGITGLNRQKIDLLISEITSGIDQSDDRFLEVTNCNNGMNFTVAGNLYLLELLAPKLELSGAMHIELLDTEGAWHSRMLQPALHEFTVLVDRHSFMPPQLLFVDNVTGKIERDPGSIKKNLINHMVSPVRWEDSVRSMIASGAKVFLECGAGKQLAKIHFFIDRSKPCQSLNSIEEISRCAALPA